AAVGVGGRGRARGLLLRADNRAPDAALGRRRAGPPADADDRERALRLVRALRPAHARLVGRALRAPLPPRVRRDDGGLRARLGRLPQARRDQPRGLVLPAPDHARGPPELALDRRAAAPARL